MKYFKWTKGRQEGTDYQKMCLLSFRIFNRGFDAYLIKYAPYTTLDWHTDPVVGGKHYRFNYTLKGTSRFCMKIGGETHCTIDGSPGWFRPDLYEHKVKTFEDKVLKISFGFVKFYK